MEKIETIADFTVIGQKVKLADTKSENVKISTDFWKKFNHNLKKAYLYQSGNWVKYAFTLRQDDELYYFCAIPKRNVVPEGFEEMIIPKKQYLVSDHVGSMSRIYDTYTEIYKKELPDSTFILDQKEFLHFEKYTARFDWNKPDSVIEIWVPVVTK